MSRVIVNIISEQTIPNYLFIKEIFQEGDELLFISSSKYSERIEWIRQTLKEEQVQSVIFSKGSEEKWMDMSALLFKQLSKESSYVVNLTGGTKYMTLLVLHVFEKFNSQFFYIPFPKNEILKPFVNDVISIKYRLTIQEYLSNYNVSFTNKEPVKSEEYTNYFFKKFLDGSLDYKVIDLLRSYRDVKKRAINSIEVAAFGEKYPQVEGLSDFLKGIYFQTKESGFLQKSEFQYLTGGWFEEYIYFKIKREINPKDIKLGVLIRGGANRNQNDLDVVFTCGNKLFVIECKTGILGVRMFNETVYKATAIKEAVLGLSANTFIVSLAPQDENLKNTARYMGIQYKCREDIENDTSIREFVNQIKEIARD